MPPGGDLRPRRRTRTWVIVAAAVLAVLLVLGVVGFLGLRFVTGLVGDAGGQAFDDGSGEMVGEVDVEVERMDLTSTVAATGSLTAGRPVTLGFTGTGEITTVDVAVGDRVVPGQVLARLDPRLAQLDLDAAEAALVAAERAAGVTSAGGADALAAQTAEARVAVASATSALAASREVAAASATGYDSAVASAARQRDRDAAAAAAAQGALAAAQAAQTPPAVRQAAAAELAAARAAAAAARDAVVVAAREVAAAVAAVPPGEDPETDRRVQTARAAEAAAATTAAAAQERVADAQDVLAAADATVEAVAAARAEAQAARAAADASAEALVAAADARRTGLASDAQTVDAARSSVSQAEAALEVLLSGGSSGAGADAGPAPEELQVAVDRARLAVETARAGLDGTTLVAPVAATVTAVDVTVGTAVGEGAAVPAAAGEAAGATTTPSPGTITLTATQALVAEITVPETDAVLLEDGMPAELKFSAIPDVVGTGQVLTVVASEPAAAGAEQGFDPFTGQPTPAQKTYTVSVAVDELPRGARAGLSVAARITTGSSPGALVVPTAAVVQAEGRTMVRVVDGEAVEEVEVDLGLRQGGFSEVVDGLAEGDTVRVGDPAAMPGPEGFVDGP